jgi:lipopolysaccharide export system permease protein
MLPAPFVASLGLLMFILLMQFLMRHMKDLIGKGLSLVVILEIIAYNLSYMLVLAVPMSVLVATLIVFGRLSESGYYRVVKASGISLVQLVRPIWIVAALVAVSMAYFNNQILPESNYRAKALWYDIRASRPAFALEPGVFYEGIDGYSIRASEIDPLANRLSGITVFDHSDDQPGRVTISARGGRLETVAGGMVINLILEDGEMHRYVDKEDEETYERLRFGEYKIPLDLRDVAFARSDLTSTTRSDRTTRSTEMARLVRDLEEDVERKQTKTAEILLGVEDQEWPKAVVDTTVAAPDSADSLMTRLQLLESVTPAIREHRGEVQELVSATVWATRRANRFRVEIHKKFSIAFACLVFVLIGIPLGLRVRRGGIGVVSAMSIGIFVIYWVSLVQGEKLADRGFLDPWFGMWAANVIIGTAALVLFTVVAGDWKHRRLRKPSN